MARQRCQPSRVRLSGAESRRLLATSGCPPFPESEHVLPALAVNAHPRHNDVIAGIVDAVEHQHFQASSDRSRSISVASFLAVPRTNRRLTALRLVPRPTKDLRHLLSGSLADHDSQLGSDTSSPEVVRTRGRFTLTSRPPSTRELGTCPPR